MALKPAAALVVGFEQVDDATLHLFHLIEPVGVLSGLSGHVVNRRFQPFQLPAGFRVDHVIQARPEGSYGHHDLVASLPYSKTIQSVSYQIAIQYHL